MASYGLSQNVTKRLHCLNGDLVVVLPVEHALVYAEILENECGGSGAPSPTHGATVLAFVAYSGDLMCAAHSQNHERVHKHSRPLSTNQPTSSLPSIMGCTQATYVRDDTLGTLDQETLPPTPVLVTVQEDTPLHVEQDQDRLREEQRRQVYLRQGVVQLPPPWRVG